MSKDDEYDYLFKGKIIRSKLSALNIIISKNRLNSNIITIF